jgi:DNA-binding CsgD family transcriptional regulator
MSVANSRNKLQAAQSIEMGDASELLRLANALHHIPRHPKERKRQLLHGLAKLIGASSGVCLVAHRKRAMQPIVVTLTHGGRTEKPRGSTPRHAKHRKSTPSSDADLLATLTTEAMNLAKASHQSLSGDRAILFSTLSLEHHDMLAGLALARRPGDQERFTHRDCELVHLFHSEMRWIYALDLPLASPDVVSLSPRPQETLQYLLAGNSEKEIAVHLGLSLNTVHHYVKRLYRHFRVSTLSELLARWVKE